MWQAEEATAYVDLTAASFRLKHRRRLPVNLSRIPDHLCVQIIAQVVLLPNKQASLYRSLFCRCSTSFQPIRDTVTLWKQRFPEIRTRCSSVIFFKNITRWEGSYSMIITSTFRLICSLLAVWNSCSHIRFIVMIVSIKICI